MTSDLPAFCVMTSTTGQDLRPLFYDYYWGSGFLPSKYQGVRFRGEGDPVSIWRTPTACPANSDGARSTTSPH